MTTADPDVNALLQALLTGVQAILGPRLVGLYLDGSLALRDFDPRSSDVDFVAVLVEEMPDGVFRALQTLHARLAREHARWGPEVEGSYITRAALAGRDPWPAAHPYIDRGSGLEMVRQEAGYWVIHRHVLREHGVALVGPAARTLIDPVAPDDLRTAVGGILREWWRPMLGAPHPATERAVPLLRRPDDGAHALHARARDHRHEAHRGALGPRRARSPLAAAHRACPRLVP